MENELNNELEFIINNKPEDVQQLKQFLNKHF